MPYVLPENREKFFFSTLMRDPLHQLLSQLKHYGGLTEGGGYSDKCSPNDDLGPVFFHTLPDCRLVDNLALRWLSGNFVGDGGPQNDVTVEDLHLAKCRLQGFDLILTDRNIAAGLPVLCKLRQWEDCNMFGEYDRQKHPALSGEAAIRNKHYIAAWIDQHRLSFSLYDFAIAMSARHLKNHGVESKLPEHPTIVEAFGEYTDVSDITLREVDKHFPVDEDAIQWKANLDHRHRVADCTKFHDAWRANVDQMPIISGASDTVLT